MVGLVFEITFSILGTIFMSADTFKALNIIFKSAENPFSNFSKNQDSGVCEPKSSPLKKHHEC